MVVTLIEMPAASASPPTTTAPPASARPPVKFDQPPARKAPDPDVAKRIASPPRKTNEKVDDYVKRTAQPRVNVDEAIAFAKATSNPVVTKANRANQMTAAAAGEDYYTLDECRQRHSGLIVWETKNVFSICTVNRVFKIQHRVCQQPPSTNCTTIGESQARLTAIGKGHNDSRTIDWEIWFDQWHLNWGAEVMTSVFTVLITCETLETQNSTCTHTPALGDSRSYLDWKQENTVSRQQTVTTSNLGNPAKSHHTFHPKIIATSARVDDYDLPTIVGRCDSATYMRSNLQNGCTFPFVDRFLEFNYAEELTKDSVGLYWDAMFHLNKIKRNVTGQFVPGGYYKQPVGEPNATYRPLTRRWPVERNDYKIQKQCRQFKDPYTKGPAPNFETGYYQCDEFPFASTDQAGAYNTEASLETWAARPVLSSHNTRTGNQVNDFFNNDRVLSGDDFFVTIINGPSGCHGCATMPLPAPVLPVPPQTDDRLGGSFIQPDLIDGWGSDDTVRAEFDSMRNLNMTTAVLQWTANSQDNRNSGARTAVYPTALPGYQQITNTDVLGRTLNIAAEKGINVWVGLQVNDHWWKTYANDTGWLANEDATARTLASDIWSKYGSKSSFAGWYLAFEMDNVNFSSTTSQDRMISFYSSVIGHLKQISGKRVAVAPFYNAVNTNLAGWQNATTWGAMWARVLDAVPIDVVALQDGIGAGHADIATLPTWFSAMKAAIDSTSSPAVLISDTETFKIGASGLQPMSNREIVSAVKAVDNYVTGYWSFSYNHYQSPRSKFASAAFHNAYSSWTSNTGGNGTDGSSPSTPGNLTALVDSPQNVILSWNSSSDSGSGVAGYHIYRNDELVADKIDSRSGFFDAQLEGNTTYKYEVRAFDGSGMESGLSNSVVVTTPPLPAAPANFARCGATAAGAPGCPYTLTGAPADPFYEDTGGRELTDGRNGPELYGEEWQGRNAPGTYEFTVDLGVSKTIKELDSRWFQVRQDYAFLPEKVEYLVSDSASTGFVSVGTIAMPAVSSRIQAKTYRTIDLNAQGRYVKVRIGGGTAWTMLDEIEVRG